MMLDCVLLITFDVVLSNIFTSAVVSIRVSSTAA